MNYVVIADFSHLFHLSRARAMSCGVPDADLEKATINNVVGKLGTVKRNLENLGIKGYSLVFAEDRLAERKIALLPTYRSGHQDLRAEKQAVKKYLVENSRISRFCHSPGNEADDTIASLVKLTLEADCHAVIVTADRDLYQLIQDRVHVYNPIKQLMVTDADVEKAFKCRPIHIPLYKALWGDYGDCVPNVLPRRQKQLLPIILKTDGTLDDLKLRIDSGDKFYLTEECYGDYLKAQEKISVNYQLVRLDDQCALVWD